MSIPVTTTHDIDGRRIAGYLGIVTGEAVMGTNFVSDWFAGIRDVLGGRSGSYQKLLNRANDNAVADMRERAADLGADAVVGVDLDYQVIGGDDKTMLLVVANGTAVKLG